MVRSRGTEARTEHASYLFVVKEYADGTPWIVLEPRNRDVAPLEHGFIGFNLNPGTTLAQASTIADYLNKNLGDLSFTMFDDHRYYIR